jgi:LysM repeat protein
MIKLLLFVGLAYYAEAPVDSLGLETINGKTFVIHKVDEKETLFAISKRYRTTVDAILQYNSGAAAGIEIGQILKVPYTPKTNTRPADAIVHEVAPKETLYSISKKYNVTVDEIKQWNNLSDNALSVGQQLSIRKKGTAATAVTPTRPVAEAPVKKGVHVVAAKETLFSISKQYGITEEQIRAWNDLDGSELKVGQTIYVSAPAGKPAGQTIVKRPDTVKAVTTRTQTNTTTPPPVVPTTTQPAEKRDPQPTTETPPVQPPIRISESYRNGSETIESGVAELIEGTEGNRKYLALHRTAPIGTILKVRNEMNNREVFVRVMGKLPDTALTNKLIIRVSKSAYDRLGAIDQRFRVEVTYYK